LGLSRRAARRGHSDRGGALDLDWFPRSVIDRGRTLSISNIHNNGGKVR
jgi:hypothetical protein